MIFPGHPVPNGTGHLHGIAAFCDHLRDRLYGNIIQNKKIRVKINFYPDNLIFSETMEYTGSLCGSIPDISAHTGL